MGWIYDIDYTKDGKPITVKVGIKNPKEVPGAYVHWIDTRGDFHHSYVAIYTKGALKDKPKSTVHGCLDKNREPILKIGKERATILLADYNSALRRYKANPEDNGFPSLVGKSDSEKKKIYEEMRNKANKFAVGLIKKESSLGNSRKAGQRTVFDHLTWKADLKKNLKEKHKAFAEISKQIANEKREFKEDYGKLPKDVKEYYDNAEKELKYNATIEPVAKRNEEIAAQAEKLRHMRGTDVYWDEKTGHLRIGPVNYEKTGKRKFKASNYIKKYSKPSRSKPSVKKASKKYLAEIDAEIKRKEKKDNQIKKNISKLGKVNARQRAAALNGF